MLAKRRAPFWAFAFLGAIACVGESPTEPKAPTQSAVRITRVEIIPKANVTLPAAATQQFTARVLWSDGLNHDAELVFEASDGTVDSTGEFRAPRRGGEVRVIARTRNGQAADTAVVGVNPPVLTSLTVSPRTATIETGSSLQFGVAALWSEGSDSLPAVEWSAPSGGTISATGQFSAPAQPGSYRVVVGHVGGTVRDTATVTVAAPTLTRLTISPESLTMSAGTQHQFTASAEWSDGSTTLPALAWSRLGAGSVSSTGRYTAPSTAGTYRVVVRHSGGTLRDTAVVTVVVPSPTVTSFRLNPEEVRLERGQSAQVSTAVTWSDGATRAVSVTYAATGGSMSNGVFTAGQVAGTFMIIATCGCGAADTTAAIVETPVLEQITIAPKTVSLQTGGSQTFTSTARWSNDETTLPPVTYSRVGGGTINATSGAYTAPGSAGTYLVIVAPQGSGLRDTAVVTVTAAPPPPPPPPPPSEFTSNLPTGVGLQLVTDSEFGNLQVNNLNADGLTYAWDGRNATDNAAPFGPGVFEIFYPGNHLGNGTGGASLYGPGDRAWRRMYFSLMMWVPSNYSMHSNEEKFFYPIVKTNGSQTSSTIFGWYITGSESTSSPTWTLGFDNQLGNPRVFQNGSAKLTKGAWHRVEYYIAMNTPGQSNGVWRVWINGEVAANLTNVRFSNSASQSVFDGIRFEGVRGGGPSSNPTPAGGQVRRYSRLAFYGSTQ
jgi:hypothetical protein